MAALSEALASDKRDLSVRTLQVCPLWWLVSALPALHFYTWIHHWHAPCILAGNRVGKRPLGSSEFRVRGHDPVQRAKDGIPGNSQFKVCVCILLKVNTYYIIRSHLAGLITLKFLFEVFLFSYFWSCPKSPYEYWCSSEWCGMAKDGNVLAGQRNVIKVAVYVKQRRQKQKRACGWQQCVTC